MLRPPTRLLPVEEALPLLLRKRPRRPPRQLLPRLRPPRPRLLPLRHQDPESAAARRTTPQRKSATTDMFALPANGASSSLYPVPPFSPLSLSPAESNTVLVEWNAFRYCNGTCYNPSSQCCSNNALASSTGSCGCNGQIYSGSSYLCDNNVLCPMNTYRYAPLSLLFSTSCVWGSQFLILLHYFSCSCGAACYSASLYSCCNGGLTPAGQGC